MLREASQHTNRNLSNIAAEVVGTGTVAGEGERHSRFPEFAA